MPALANKSLFVLKKQLLFYCTVALHTPEGKFLQVPSSVEPVQSNGSPPVQGSSETCRKMVTLQILPKGKGDTHVLQEWDELTNLEKT